jgi:hypothetical protein
VTSAHLRVLCVLLPLRSGDLCHLRDLLPDLYTLRQNLEGLKVPHCGNQSIAPSVKKSRILIITGLVLVLLVVSGWLGVRSFVQGDNFRQWLSKKVSQSLHVDGQFESLTWEGASFSSPKFNAVGAGGSKLTSLILTDVSAHFDFWQIFKWHWVIDRVSVNQVDAVVGKRPTQLAHLKSNGHTDGIRLPDFVPSELIIEHIYLPLVNLHWETHQGQTGEWIGASIDAKGEGKGQWQIKATGGLVRHAEFPQLKINDGDATLSHDSIAIHDLEAQVMTGGDLRLKGNIATGHLLNAKLSCDFSNLDVARISPGDWHLTGKSAGHMDYTGDLNQFDKGRFNSSLQIANATIDLSPLLGRVRQLIKLGGLDQVRVDTISVDLDYQNQQGQFSNLLAAYQDEVRLQGSGSFGPERLEATIQIGLAPSVLVWIPGSSEQVFTEDRDGLRWATAKISGTPEKPKEDLSKRLLSAAQNKMSNEFKNNAKDAAKALLDLFRQ